MSPGLSIINSLRYSIFATVVDVFLGVIIGYLVVRRRSTLTALLDNIAMMPLAVPGLVVAFGYFALTQSVSWLSFLNPLKYDPTALLVLTYSLRRLPFIVRSCAAGIEQIPVSLEEAARGLGAGPVRTLGWVVVPLLAPNILAGALIVFSRSMLEVSDSLVLAFDTNTYPMMKAIWALVAIPQDGIQSAAALGTVGMLLLAVTMCLGSLIMRRRLGMLFRV
jgi:iron(III) transport system permease protein